jgi:hypothetical protein
MKESQSIFFKPENLRRVQALQVLFQSQAWLQLHSEVNKLLFSRESTYLTPQLSFKGIFFEDSQKVQDELRQLFTAQICQKLEEYVKFQGDRSPVELTPEEVADIVEYLVTEYVEFTLAFYELFQTRSGSRKEKYKLRQKLETFSLQASRFGYGQDLRLIKNAIKKL